MGPPRIRLAGSQSAAAQSQLTAKRRRIVDVPAVIARLHRSGIGTEAGLAHPEDAKRLLSLGLDRLALRLLVEVNEQERTHASAIVDEILAVLRTADVPKPVLLHGANASAWPLLQRAVESGFSTRIGLEDVKFLPDGSPAELNTDSRRFVWVFRAIYDEACLIYG